MPARALWLLPAPGTEHGVFRNGSGGGARRANEPAACQRALACDNIDQTHQELAARGVEFVAPPTKQPWGSFAIFKDLDGNTFVLSTR